MHVAVLAPLLVKGRRLPSKKDRMSIRRTDYGPWLRHKTVAEPGRTGLRLFRACSVSPRTKNFLRRIFFLSSMRHKDLTNRKTGRPFCVPLAHVTPVSCECHLDCHVLPPVSYQHIIAIIKLKKLPLVRGPARRFRIAPVSKCLSSLSRFRA